MEKVEITLQVRGWGMNSSLLRSQVLTYRLTGEEEEMFYKWW